MSDNRKIVAYLSLLRGAYPDSLALVEALEEEIQKVVPSITPEEKRAIRQFPMQYTKPISQSQGVGDWTTQLHIWAEQGIPDILKVSPQILAYKNSFGDSIIMSLVAGATGAITGKIDYKLIRDILDTDMSYLDNSSDMKEFNALDETDIEGKTPIDHLVEIAYGIGEYTGDTPDEILKKMLRNFAENKSNDDLEFSEQVDSVIDTHLEDPIINNTKPEIIQNDA
jgi:hypothetical protein